MCWKIALDSAIRQRWKKRWDLPAQSKLIVLRQIFNLIPDFLVPKIARETGVADQARTFTPWSHVVSLAYSHLAHAIGLNDVCDALQLIGRSIAGERPPPSATSVWTRRAFCRALPSLTPRVMPMTNGLARCARMSRPARSPYLTVVC